MRFNVVQAAIPIAEVEIILIYVALCGWLVPLGVTTTYCLFTQPRTSTTSVHIPRQKRTTRANAATAVHPPRQPGCIFAACICKVSMGLAQCLMGVFRAAAGVEHTIVHYRRGQRYGWMTCLHVITRVGLGYWLLYYNCDEDGVLITDDGVVVLHVSRQANCLRLVHNAFYLKEPNNQALPPNKMTLSYAMYGILLPHYLWIVSRCQWRNQ